MSMCACPKRSSLTVPATCLAYYHANKSITSPSINLISAERFEKCRQVEMKPYIPVGEGGEKISKRELMYSCWRWRKRKAIPLAISHSVNEWGNRENNESEESLNYRNKFEFRLFLYWNWIGNRLLVIRSLFLTPRGLIQFQVAAHLLQGLMVRPFGGGFFDEPPPSAAPFILCGLSSFSGPSWECEDQRFGRGVKTFSRATLEIQRRKDLRRPPQTGILNTVWHGQVAASFVTFRRGWLNRQ